LSHVHYGWDSEPSGCPTIEIAGLTFDGGDAVDANGILWMWQTLAGWWTTNVRYDAAVSASGEGEVVLDVVRGPRPLTLSGFIGVEDRDMWWQAANLFEAAFEPLMSRATPGTLVVNEPGGAKSLSVYVPAPTQLSRVGIVMELSNGQTTSGHRFMVPLIAPNPEKT
jgi:hypothetical protein